MLVHVRPGCRVRTHLMSTIRRLNIGEAELYRAIRLDSLRDSPQAFASTYESALNRDSDSWTAQADEAALSGDRAIFIVLTDCPIALAGIYRDPERSFLRRIGSNVGGAPSSRKFSCGRIAGSPLRLGIPP